MKSTKKVLRIAFILVLFGLFLTPASAQLQQEGFSGNSKSSYQCFDEFGNSIEPTDQRDNQGYWLCPCDDGSNPIAGTCAGASCNGSPGSAGCPAQQAVLIPPTLYQLQIWFVRIVYVIWALTASFSFFWLAYLGYQYMLTRGDVTKITAIRQKIIYFFIGTALIFLAVPILTTVFNVIGINNEVECYDVQMPGFQFFFTDLCTTPTLASGDLCSYLNTVGEPDGKACNEEGSSVSCFTQGPVYFYQCQNNIWVRK